MMNEELPSLGEQLEICRPEMEAAETKAEARDAAEPLLGLTVLYGQAMEDGDGLTDITIRKVSEITPLTAEEVEEEIERMTWEFVEDVANE